MWREGKMEELEEGREVGRRKGNTEEMKIR